MICSTTYDWTLIRAGTMRLDGGGMFGVVPRTIWAKSAPPDELNRVPIAHNCIYLTRTDTAGKQHRILIETGSGDKFDPKLTGIYCLESDDIVTALGRIGVDATDIQHVVPSHLHFDHAGGLTRRVRAGETPDVIDPIPAKLSFPNAIVHIQQREWDDGIINKAVMTRTYLPENLKPIQAQARFVQAPAPFAAGHVPGKIEMPPVPLVDRMVEVLPGIFVFLVPGHTWGQQAILFRDTRGQTVVFTPDVMPTIHHVGQAYNTGYDVEPYTSGVTRHWFLEEAMKGNWLLVLDHEVTCPLNRVQPDGKGWYQLIGQEHP